MDDDLNTSAALAVLFELAKGLQREGNRLVHEGKSQSSKRKFARCDRNSALAGFGLGLDPAVFEVELPSVVDAVQMHPS